MTGAPLAHNAPSPTPIATRTTRSVSRNLRPPTQTFRAICGSPWKPMSLLHTAGQRPGWEPSWEPFGVDRGGRVWTLVEVEAYC